MLIREAKLADLDQITELERLCFPPTEAASREAFKERLTYYPNHFWLLEETEIKAFVNGFVTDLEHLEDEMFHDASKHHEQGKWQMIFGVDTSPNFRNQGYATLLIKHVIKIAKQQQRKGVVLTCKNHLIHFYAKFGFVDEGISCSQHGGVAWHEMRIIF